MTDLARHLKLLDEALWHRLRLDGFRAFVLANKNLMIYLAALAAVAFGYDLFTFSLKIDSEFHTVSFGAKVQWITQGRWGMYFLNAWLMPDAVMPFIPMLIGLLGLACGVFFFLLSLSGQRTPSDYLAAPMAIGCPLLAFSFYFTTLNYGLGVALAVVGAGFFALTRWRWSSAVWAIACFAFAIGIYQATLLLMPVFFGFYLVVLIITDSRLSFRWLLLRIGAFCAVMLLAYGLYELIGAVALRAYNLRYAKEYLEGYLNWTTDPSYWSTTIGRTVAIGKAYYMGGADYYLYPLRILAALFYIALAVTVVQLLTASQSVAVKIVGLLALAGSLCAPLSMHLLNAGYMPPRTVLGVPFVLAGLVFSASFKSGRALRILLGLLVLACFFKFAVVNSRYALTNQLNWKADQDLSLLVLQRIHSVLHEVPDQTPPYPIALVGMLRQHESPLYIQRDLIGSSFYNANGGNVSRVVGLLRGMRHFEFREASSEEALAVAEQAGSMPVWPADGSVGVVKGVIVVKIGEYMPHQITALCESAPTSDFCKQRTQQAFSSTGAAVVSLVNYQGLWSNSPAGSEVGWGIDLAHQGDTIFTLWATYDLSGRSWWLVMSAQKRAQNVYSGTLFQAHGPPLDAAVFNPADVITTPVGSGVLRFSDANNGTFEYTVNGVHQMKAITRAVFGPMSRCTFGGQSDLALATNYQDLWWAAPAASESGWGVSLNHQGDTLLATWFTYDLDGAPLWLTVTAPKTAPGVYAGDLYRMAGARFDAFNAAAVRSTKVGSATFTFADGNRATFAYTVTGVGPNTVTQTKSITRQVFARPGTVCR